MYPEETFFDKKLFIKINNVIKDDDAIILRSMHGSILVETTYRLSYNWFGVGNEVKNVYPIQLDNVYIYPEMGK